MQSPSLQKQPSTYSSNFIFLQPTAILLTHPDRTIYLSYTSTLPETKPAHLSLSSFLSNSDDFRLFQCERTRETSSKLPEAALIKFHGDLIALREWEKFARARRK